VNNQFVSSYQIIEPQSDKCGGHGSVDSCGQCKCDPGYYGLRCECDGRFGMTTESALQPCIRYTTYLIIFYFQFNFFSSPFCLYLHLHKYKIYTGTKM
jgi:hypothetical protein